MIKSGHNLWPWFEVHLESERSGANNTWFSDNLHLGHLVDLMMKVMLMMMVVPMVVATTKIWVMRRAACSFYGGQVLSGI